MPGDLRDPAAFRRRFARLAFRIRFRLASRAALAGLTAGMLVAATGATVAFFLRLGELRPWTFALGAIGLLLALGWAARRRWSDGDVALYLDARLGGDEAISTAVELLHRPRPTPADEDEVAAAVVDRAAELLEGATPRAIRMRLWRRVHALALLGAGLVGALCFLPLPPLPPAPPPPTGAELVKTEALAGLEKLVGLEKLDARDAEQRARLDEIARRARELQADLARGLPKREAQARLAELRDAVSHERLALGDGKNRAGLDAAVRKLGSDQRLKRAADALGAGDLTDFDQEMQKLANRAEEEARESAKQALEEAEKAARDRGAQQLADALSRERGLFAEREARGEALRELARGLGDALSDEARRDLEEFSENGDPEAARRLAEALDEALQGLSDEERKRLAEQLRRSLSKEGMADPMTRDELEDLAKRLANPEERDALRQQLKDLANRDPSLDAERQQGLDDAEGGGAEAERELGVIPIPSPGAPGPACPKPGSDGNGQESDSDGTGQGGPGSHHDRGRGDHQGSTEEVPGDRLRAKARAHLDPTGPLRQSTEGRGRARAGETANQQGTGVLGQIGAAEVDAVERSEVPQEYREQVGRYFQP